MIDLLSTVLDDASKSVRVIGSFVFHAPVYRVTEHDTNTSSDIYMRRLRLSVYMCPRDGDADGGEEISLSVCGKIRGLYGRRGVKFN